jgi:transposase
MSPAAVLFRELRRLGYGGGLTTLKLYLDTLKPTPQAEPPIPFETQLAARCRPILPLFARRRSLVGVHCHARLEPSCVC